MIVLFWSGYFLLLSETMAEIAEKLKDDANRASSTTDHEAEGAKTAEAQIKDKAQEEAETVAAATETEPKTGFAFPTRLHDGKQLNTVGLRKKNMLGLGLKIYAFGMYADNVKLRDLLRSKVKSAPQKATKEMYEVVIDSDVRMTVRLIISFPALTMSMVRKNFDETLGAAMKKITGGQKNEELVNRVMGAANDSIKLSSGSVIEISRLPGFILQTKVKEEIVSTVESELLCRAYFHMYLGDDPFDKEAKERFGISLLSLL